MGGTCGHLQTRKTVRSKCAAQCWDLVQNVLFVAAPSPGWEEILTNQPQKHGKSGKMGRKREKLEENVKLAPGQQAAHESRVIKR